MTIPTTKHNKISYVELPAKDIPATKAFFTQVFGWTFEDFGTDYTAFADQGVDGGFFKADLTSTTQTGGALIVIYSQNLKETQTKIEAAGGVIVQPIFSFPGGYRFHFTEPSGNEFAVWSETVE